MNRPSSAVLCAAGCSSPAAPACVTRYSAVSWSGWAPRCSRA